MLADRQENTGHRYNGAPSRIGGALREGEGDNPMLMRPGFLVDWLPRLAIWATRCSRAYLVEISRILIGQHVWDKHLTCSRM